MNWSLYITFGAVVVPLLIMAIFLLNGKGAFLIAGYNTMSKAKRARYDEKALCRAVGWLLIALSVCFAIIPLGLYLNITWLPFVSIALVLAATIGFMVYANTGKRFLKEDVEEIDAPAKPTIKVIVAAVGIAVAVCIAIGAMTFFGSKDPVIHVLDSGIKIKAMYGTTIDFSEVSEITLIEKSMREIGTGSRINGYGGFGEALKGHFRFSGSGDALLFVQANSSPTIKIERNGQQDIYLSLRDGEATRALYSEMTEAFS